MLLKYILLLRLLAIPGSLFSLGLDSYVLDPENKLGYIFYLSLHAQSKIPSQLLVFKML